MTVEHVLQRLEARAEEFAECPDLQPIADELRQMVATVRAELREEFDREYRHCSAEGCSWIAQIPRSFCTRHWRAIGEDLRYRILSSHVHGEDSPEYLAAKSAAVETVAKAEGCREPSAFPDFQTEVVP